MASIVGLTNGASQQQPAVDPALGHLVQQLSRLRADIVAGKHSRFRVPAHMVATVLPPKPVPSLGQPLPVNASAFTFPPAINQTNVLTNQALVPPLPPSVPDPREVLQQRRQELERILEEQVQQKRQLSKQKPCDQEIFADFDVTETLRLAHERVKPWRPSNPANANRSGSSSDSFDENTFYSSQMNESTTTEEIEPPKNPKRPLRACRFFRQGKECPYGEKCTFSHDPQVVKQVEAEEQQRAAIKQDRNNDHGNRRAASLPRKPVAKAPAPKTPPVDPQAAKIAELEAQLKQMKEQQQKPSKPSKPKILPQAIERPDSVPPQVDEGRDQNKREQYREPLPPPPVPVIRNHITTPHAPQPSRVSPLTSAKPAQVVRLQHTYNDDIAQSNGQVTDHSNSRGSPAIVPANKGNRKRKRAQHAEDNTRKVATRTQSVQSPGVYIKEEPVSPPPLNGTSRLRPVQAQQPDVRMVPAVRAPSRVLPQIPQPTEDGRYVFQPLIEAEEPYTPGRRVVSHQVPQYVERDDQDLRRVASTRNLRQRPASPGFDASYSDPQPRMGRAASTVQYVKEPPMPPPQYHRASVQPAGRDPMSQPRQIELTPDRPQIITMAPPPRRRIVMDEYGRQYEEVSVPPPQPQVRYQSLAADGPIYQPAQPARYADSSRYVQGDGSPTSPRYVEYAQPNRKTSMVRLDQDDYEPEIYPPASRVARYAPQTLPQPYDEVSQYQEERPRAQRVQQPIEDQYDQSPQQHTREVISRMGSVKPQAGQPRLVRLGENEDEQTGRTRQVSVRPETYARQQPVYQYAQQQGQTGGYEDNGEQMDVYDQRRRTGQRIVRM